MNISIIPAPKELLIHEGIVSSKTTASKYIDNQLNQNAYRVSIQKDGIILTAGSTAALRHAESTLAQIQLQSADTLPCLEIEDEPAFIHRSFHIDCARHFFPVEELKKMIAMAGYFKLNRFHWVFSNDQGWRIESKRFPKLHEIGAYRDGDHSGNYSSNAREGNFYTQAQVRELVDYAAGFGMEIVPELDMPGHVTALLAAYPELSCTGKSVSVGTKAGIYPDLLCAGRDEVICFVEELIDELLELFPGKYFHIGGDEAPKTSWLSCPHCQKRMCSERLSTPQQLQGWFENQVISCLHARRKAVITWQESAYGGNLNTDAVVQLWQDDKEGHVAAHLSKGGQILLSPMMNSYCDYPHGFISLKSVYELDTVPQNVGQDQIIGTECLLWTEYVRTPEQLERLAWPRFAASAEVGWCGMGRPGYEDFTRRLTRLMPAFRQYGITATGPEGWVPEGELKEAQFAEFRKNLIPGIVEEYAKAGDAV